MTQLDANDPRHIRSRMRADRIRELVPIADVLSHYGYAVRTDAAHREQQFSCDLHGDGRDGKPSARVYPYSQSWYCVGLTERVLTSRGWMRLGDVRRVYQGRFWRDWEYLGHYPDSCGPRPYRCLRCGKQVTVQSGDELDRHIDAHICPQAWAIADLPSAIEVADGNGKWEREAHYTRPAIGGREVVRVMTTAGYSVVVTKDHEIEIVGRGWVRADGIHPGDVLVVPKPAAPRFSKNRNLPVGDLNKRTYHNHPRLKLPRRWSLDLGECLGYVFGDGWVVPREDPASGVVGITSHADDVDDARRVFRLMQKWAAGRGSEVHRTDVTHIHGKEYVQDQYVFSIGNDGFCEFLQRLDMGKVAEPQDRRLPESIWQAPEEGVRGFLRGVYATDGSVFRPKGRKGIKVNLYSVSGGFLLDVQLLLLQFGLHSRVHPPSNSKKDGKLTHPCWYLHLATGQDILTFRDRIGIANKRKQNVLDSFTYNPRGSRPFRPVVKMVSPVGDMPVGDISMPHEHSFIAGGIKVHNCFACDKTRDAIETVRAKEGLDFWPAVRKLEVDYNLPALPVEQGFEPPDPLQQMREVLVNLDPQKTFDDDLNTLTRLLEALSSPPRQLTRDQALSLWEGLDQVVLNVRGPKGEGGPWDEEKGRAILAALQLRAVLHAKEHQMP